MNRATIQIDADNIWCYLQDLGIDDKSDILKMYSQTMDQFLDIFDQFNVKATIFCIGEDAKDKNVQKILRNIKKRGHEVANHSLMHSQNFANLNAEELLEDIKKSDELLSVAIGEKVTGFKAPGWGINPNLYPTLEKLGYKYDSSVMPSFLLPLLGIARFIMSGLTPSQKKFGKFRNGFISQKPYLAKYQNNGCTKEFTEVPNSTFPFLKMPFHSTFGFLLGLTYVRMGILLWNPKSPMVYVFHLLDLLDENADSRLVKFPAMKLPLERRREIVKSIVSDISKKFDAVVPTKELIESL